jgi:predicted O-methyltransferase YrrM
VSSGSGTSIRRLVKKLPRLSPAKVAEILRAPWKVEVFFSAPSPHTPSEAAALLFPGTTAERAEALRRSFLGDAGLHEELNASMVAVRGRRVTVLESYELLYLAVRLLRPRVTIETGVFDGLSSAVLLRAMEENGEGELVSIDLPARAAITHSTHLMPETTLPPGREPGWLIPDRLRARHRLVIGDSRETLPRVLGEVGAVELFLHDSLHTAEAQRMEYELAWPRLASGGLLLSDDVLASPAFFRFARRVGARPVCLENYGAIRKP